jgi:hypothetical protein
VDFVHGAGAVLCGSACATLLRRHDWVMEHVEYGSMDPERAVAILNLKLRKTEGVVVDH